MIVKKRWSLALLAGAVAITRLVFRSHYLYDLDSVNFALAMKRFDPSVHQPHPPGYFLYICPGRLLNAVFHDANLALVVLSILASCGAVIVIYEMTLDWFNPMAARFARHSFPALSARVVSWHRRVDLHCGSFLFGTAGVSLLARLLREPRIRFTGRHHSGSICRCQAVVPAVSGAALSVFAAQGQLQGEIHGFRRARSDARRMVCAHGLRQWRLEGLLRSFGVALADGAIERDCLQLLSCDLDCARVHDCLHLLPVLRSGFAGSVGRSGSQIAGRSRKEALHSSFGSPRHSASSPLAISNLSTAAIFCWCACPACMWLGFWVSEWYEASAWRRLDQADCYRILRRGKRSIFSCYRRSTVPTDRYDDLKRS